MDRTPAGNADVEAFPKRRGLFEHYSDLVEALSELKATRRSMLLGAAGMSAALPLIGPLVRAACNFNYVTGEHTVEISIAGIVAWRIDRRWFDGNPKLQVRRAESSIHVHLRQALFPGTNVPADLLLQAKRVGAEWTARLTLEGLGFDAEVPFHLWLLGYQRARSPIAIDRIHFRGAPTLRIDALRGLASFGPDWMLDLEDFEQASMRMGGQLAPVDSVHIELSRESFSVPHADVANHRLTSVWPRLASNAPLDFTATVPGVSLNARHADIFIGASSHSTRLQAQQRDGTALLNWQRQGQSQTDIRLAAQVVHLVLDYAGQHPSAIGVAHLAEATWHDAGEFVAEFRHPVNGGKILLTSTDASFDDDTTNRAAGSPRASRFIVSLSGCDVAMFRARNATGSSAPPQAYGEDIISFVHGRIPLDGYDLDLRRAADGLVVTLRFRNVDLKFTSNGWLLTGGDRWPGAQSLVEFDFGSQHLMEEAIYISDWCQHASGGACNSSSADTLPVPDEVAALAMLRALAQGMWSELPNPPVTLAWMHENHVGAEDLAFLLDELNSSDTLRNAFSRFTRDPLLRVLLGDRKRKKQVGRKAERAQSSHLLFEFGANNWLPLTLDALFAWATPNDTPLTLVRPMRARELGVLRLTNEADPDRPVITRPLSLRQPLTELCEYATGIEVPARLVISPINKDVARWRQSTSYLTTSRALPPRNELWSVRLVNARVRAVFTPDARAVKPESCAEWPECPDCPPQTDVITVDIFNPPNPYAGSSTAHCEFRATTDSRDRHELVALTSLYGFHALCGSDQVLDCDAKSGVYMPMPIDAALLQITSLGANFKFKGFWNPPASTNNRGALSVTRYDHHGQIGRDIRARVEYKGFLFPLGHPAILIKLTERRFCIKKSEHGLPQSVASLVQRFFIHVPPFTRAFPAINQPNENRYWGHASISIAEFTTPDLAAPEHSDVCSLGQSAFWPMTLCGADIPFPFGETNTKSSYSAPQVFIDNNVAHNDELLLKVIRYWRSRTVDHLSAHVDEWPDGIERGYAQVLSGRLPYVAGMHGNNTDIETDQILLDVHTAFDNGYDYVADPEPVTTPAMEAQNQPPFYPVRRRSRVALTQISTITGNTGKRYLMQYDLIYGKQGFAAPANAGQIFASFVDVAPAMDFGGNTSRSGGFASPSASITYLSAKRGLIGGRQSDLEPLVPPARKLLPRYGKRDTEDTSSTPEHNGDFDPTAFFSTFIGDAKLLGIVRIVDILKVALAASGTKIPTVNRENLFDLAESALRRIVPIIAGQLACVADMFSREDQIPSAVAARLGPGLTSMQADAAALRATLAATPVDDAKMIAQLRDFGSAANAFSSQANAIANEPELLIPDNQLVVLKQLKAVLDALRQLQLDDLVSGWLRPMAQTLVEDALAQQIEQLRTAVASSPEFNSLRQTLQALEMRVNAMAALAQSSGARTAISLWNDYQQLLATIAEYRREVAALVDPTLQTAATLKADVDKLTHIVETTLCVIGTLSIHTDDLGSQVSVFIATVSEQLANLEKDLAERKTLDPDLRGKAERALARGRQAANALADDLTNDIARLRFKRQRYSKPTANEQPPGNAVALLGEDVIVDRVALLVMQIDYVTTLPRRIVTQANRLIEVIQAALDYRSNFTLTADGKLWEDCAQLVSLMGNAFASMKATLNHKCAELQLTSLAAHLNAFASQLDQFAADASLQAPLAGVAQAARDAATQAIALNTDLTAAVDASGKPVTFDLQAFCAAPAAYAKEFMARHAGELTSLDAFAADCANVAQILAWWNGVAQTLPATTAALMQKLATTLDERIQRQAQTAIAAGSADFCAALSKVATALAPFVPFTKNEVSVYVSAELLASLKDVYDQVQPMPCPPAAPTWPAALLAAVNSLGTLLARAASFQGVGRLVDVNRIVSDIIASLGVPTRVRVTYDWETDVHAFPEGDDAVFEPLDERTLTIHATAEAGVQGGPPTATMNAELSSFKINLFGKGSENFLSITLDRLTLELPAGGKLQCKTNVLLVEPGPALGFVQSLETLFGGDSGFLVLPTFNGIMVGYEYHEDIEELGGFVIQNIAFSIYASLPFDNSPVRFTMKLADKIKPFLMSAGIYGGGGFFGIQTRVDTLEVLEASFEYGLVTGFKFGVLTGSGRITAGVYIRLGGRSPAIEGFFCAVGEVSIADLITMGASLRVSLDYSLADNTMSGTADYEFHFSIGFVQFSYHVTVEYLRNGDKGKTRQQQNGQSADASTPLAIAAADTPALEYDATPAMGSQEHALCAEAWRQLWASTLAPDNRTTIAQSSCAPRPASLA